MYLKIPKLIKLFMLKINIVSLLNVRRNQCYILLFKAHNIKIIENGSVYNKFINIFFDFLLD